MGQEIDSFQFTQQDYDEFRRRLGRETELLKQWFEQDRFDQADPVAGFELEAWLVNRQMQPAPVNAEFLEQMNSPLMSPELSKFNVEFNVDPVTLKGNALNTLQSELSDIWSQGETVAKGLATELAMIGILPTVEDHHLCMDNISALNRYAALNAEVLRQRGGRALNLNIHGREVLHCEHSDVMLESATTSFQIHLQTPLSQSVRAYNASIIASAPLLAVSANSPYLFGKDVWDETRIPLFEQSVEVGGFEQDSHGPMRRVSFGSGYARQSVYECFIENLEHFPVLLPVLYDEPEENLHHLRLHNGTLWRWNRPLIGFNDGVPHLRVEQRVVPAGPTIVDSIANAALFYGLAQALMTQDIAPETQLSFAQARDNFYNSAKHGLNTPLLWLDGEKYPLKTLFKKQILPLAHQGLQALKIDPQAADYYLGIIEQRIDQNQNGTNWQRAYVTKYGHDMAALLKAYLVNQQAGHPVHEWEI